MVCWTGNVRRRSLFALGLASAASAVSAGASACSTGVGSNGEAGGDNQVEVFSWWAGPGEKEGLDAMVADFKKQDPGVDVRQRGGRRRRRYQRQDHPGRAGSQNNDPPDSYQAPRRARTAGRHQGRQGARTSRSSTTSRAGRTSFPKGLLDSHHARRQDLLGAGEHPPGQPRLVQPEDAGRSSGIAAPPKTWAEFLTQATRLKAKGITPLASARPGPRSTCWRPCCSASSAPDKYNGLWGGKTDWKGADVHRGLGVFGRVLDVSDLASAAGDWQPPWTRSIAGTAAYNVMGDWADAYLGRSKKLDVQDRLRRRPVARSDGIYDFLSDSFTLPRGAPHRRPPRSG